MNNLEKLGLTTIIVAKIKKENSSGSGLMSDDDDNQRLVDIFIDINVEFDVELKDDEDTLCDLLGLDNFHKIRDAESNKNSGTINQFIKRFTKKCDWCNKEYDGCKVSKFCCNACRQRNKRAKH